MGYDPKLSRYAIKYLYKNKETGKLFGPHKDFEYEIGSWYTSEGTILCCNNGFHVPSYNDIFLENYSWYDEYAKLNDYHVNDLIIALVEVSGYLSNSYYGYCHLDTGKIAFKRIKIIKEITIDLSSLPLEGGGSRWAAILNIVNKLNKKYRTIYHEDFDKYVFTNRLNNTYLIK